LRNRIVRGYERAKMKTQYKDLSAWLKVAVVTSLFTFGYYVLMFLIGFYYGFLGAI